MKTTLILFLIFSSIYASADCPKVTGKYFCSKDAAEDLALGSQNVSIQSKDPRIFIFLTGKGNVLYELNSWNPAISLDGRIDYSIETMATCSEDKLLLKNKVTDVNGQPTITVNQDFEISTNTTGINLRILVDGDEFFNFNCNSVN